MLHIYKVDYVNARHLPGLDPRSTLQPFAKRLMVADFGNLKTNKKQQTLNLGLPFWMVSAPSYYLITSNLRYIEYLRITHNVNICEKYIIWADWASLMGDQFQQLQLSKNISPSQYIQQYGVLYYIILVRYILCQWIGSIALQEGQTLA
jgi:hypothetical protein